MVSANTNVTITPLNAPSNALTFGLMGDSTLQPATASGGTGGIQIMDRPRLVAALYWYDRSPFELDLPLIIDSEIVYGADGGSVEYQCRQIRSWLDPVGGTIQPPVLSVTGPVDGVEYLWWLYSVEYDEAIRDPQGGFRTQQKIKVVLYEFNSSTQNVLGAPSPAQAALYQYNGSIGSQAYTLYTVVVGDTLSSISATQLGTASEWQTIAALNNLRDPNFLTAGQVLKLPSS